MKVYLRFSTVALLGLVACSRPDSDLFGDTGGAIETPAGGGSGSSTSAAGSSSSDMGASTSADMTTTSGGSTPQPTPAAGTSSTAGTAATAGNGPSEQGGSSSGGGGGGNGGSANPADPGGSAGVADGGASNPDPVPVDPVCGNGILEDGEQCDDAGHVGQDGCDANCKVVCSQHGQGALESEDHHCYLGYDAFPFTGAEQDCVKRGAHLATIANDAENKLALKLVNNSKWIGGYEDVAASEPGTGDYQWLTGEPFTYTNWGPQEPNRLDMHCGGSPNQHCYEHCIALMGDGTWADHRCDMSDGYVCEWEPAGAN